MQSLTHQYDFPYDLLDFPDPQEGLRFVGPLLQGNPQDLLAWYACAVALFNLGEREVALENLENVGFGFARDANPLLAVAVAKQVESFGGDGRPILSLVAELYCAQSSRISEADVSLPPLLVQSPASAWKSELDLQKVIARTKDAMAMASGASMLLKDKRAKLPYIPLLSALNKDDGLIFLNSLKRNDVQAGSCIIEQGEKGNTMYLLALGEISVTHRSVSQKSDQPPITLARLGPGSFVGEMALVSNGLRAAEVTAETGAVLLQIDKRSMENLAHRSPRIVDVLIAFCHVRMLQNLMRISPLFSSVPMVKRPDLISRFHTDYYPKGTVVMEEGVEGPGLFLIVSGVVSVIKKIEGENIQMARLGPGDFFGEISLLLQTPSSAMIIAEENTALLTLNRKDFDSVTNEFPQLAKDAYDIAVKREQLNLSILGQTAVDADGLVLI